MSGCGHVSVFRIKQIRGHIHYGTRLGLGKCMLQIEV